MHTMANTAASTLNRKTCELRGCKSLATHETTWRHTLATAKDIVLCDEHAIEVDSTCRALGEPVTTRPL
jgi:hypothetical protein